MHLVCSDYAIIAIIVLSFILAVWRGFFRELLSLVVWILAFLVPVFFGKMLSSHLTDMIQHETTRITVSYFLLFAVTFIVFGLIASLLSRFLTASGLSLGNRVLGGIFGLLRGFFLVITILVICSLSGYNQSALWQESTVIPYFSKVVTLVDQKLLNSKQLSAMKAQIPQMTQKTNSSEQVALQNNTQESAAY